MPLNDTIFKSTITIRVPYATDRYYLNSARVEEGWLILADDTKSLYVIKDITNLDNSSGYTNLSAGGGGGAWGDVTGTLADQTDLQAALDEKVDAAGGTLADGTLTGTTEAETINADHLNVTDVVISSVLSTDDTAVGTKTTGRNAGEDLTQWQAVYLGGSSTWLKADANGSGTYPARGLVVATVTSGNAATVLEDGFARNDAWNWTPGGDLYLSATAGDLTQTAPSTSGDKVQPVGYAVTADIIRWKPSPIYLTVT